MLYCFGTVSWNGYLERYIDIFVDNYITLYKKLISVGVRYCDIADPKVVYSNDIPSVATETAIKKLEETTGKKLILVNDKHKYTVDTIMYSTRNRLRTEFRKSYPDEQKVFWYFPIDDHIREDAVYELISLSKQKTPTACMFKFFVKQTGGNFTASTRPITSYKDIHPGDWGGYCAYNILDEEQCPLYPKISIPNVAFYAELYEVGYKQYESKAICVDHLRHGDSHHFKYKDTHMSEIVKQFLMDKRAYLQKKGYK